MKNQNKRLHFGAYLVILTVILVILFAFTATYKVFVDEQQTKLNQNLATQSALIKNILQPVVTAPNEYRRNLNQEQALNQLTDILTNIQSSNPNLAFGLAYKTQDNSAIQLLTVSKKITQDPAIEKIFKEAAQQALQNLREVQRIEQSAQDYYYRFSGYSTVIPQQWALVLYSDSKAISKQLLSALFITIIASSLLLFLLIFFARNNTGFINEHQQNDLTDLIEKSNTWVWEIDINGKIKSSNNEVENILGYSLLEIQNHPIEQYFDLNFNHNSHLIFKQHLMQKNAFSHLEIAFKHRQGDTVHLLMTAYPIQQNKDLTFRGLATDITATKNRENKIINQALFDPLTALINRQHFIDQLDKHIQRKKITKEPKTSAVLFIDLDGFKKVNDSKGHEVGDKLLQTVAKRLKNHIRQQDLLSRFGGDEFVMLIKSQEGDKITTFNAKLESYLKRIIESLNDEIIVDKHNLQIGASIGVALLPQDGKSVTEVLNHADMAMYEAKARGKNTYEFFNLNTKSAVDKKIKTSGELEAAISNNELELYYQLQYQDDKVIGLEALLRWHHPLSRKILSAHEFIENMQTQYQTHLIDEWVIKQVANDMATIKTKSNINIPVAINLSTQEMFETSLPQNIENAFKAVNVEPHQLSIEVSENILAENFAKTSQTIKKLDKLGVSTIIDHFGTGNLSLFNLQRMPIKAIKIDRNFIKSIASSPADLQMSRAIIQLAKSLQIKVIAGCIETSLQKDILEKEGCDMYQGYHFSKPITLSKLIEKLSTVTN